MIAETYVQFRIILAKLVEELLGTTDFLLLYTTQICRSIYAFGLNDDVQFLASICLLYHVHEVRAIRIIRNRRNGYTFTRNLTKHNDLINIRCSQILLLQFTIVCICIVEISVGYPCAVQMIADITLHDVLIQLSVFVCQSGSFHIVCSLLILKLAHRVFYLPIRDVADDTSKRLVVNHILRKSRIRANTFTHSLVERTNRHTRCTINTLEEFTIG